MAWWHLSGSRRNGSPEKEHGAKITSVQTLPSLRGCSSRAAKQGDQCRAGVNNRPSPTVRRSLDKHIVKIHSWNQGKISISKSGTSGDRAGQRQWMPRPKLNWSSWVHCQGLPGKAGPTHWSLMVPSKPWHYNEICKSMWEYKLWYLQDLQEENIPYINIYMLLKYLKQT